MWLYFYVQMSSGEGCTAINWWSRPKSRPSSWNSFLVLISPPHFYLSTLLRPALPIIFVSFTSPWTVLILLLLFLIAFHLPLGLKGCWSSLSTSTPFLKPSWSWDLLLFASLLLSCDPCRERSIVLCGLLLCHATLNNFISCHFLEGTSTPFLFLHLLSATI